MKAITDDGNGREEFFGPFNRQSGLPRAFV